MKIKKRWFRNYYVVEVGRGYALKYEVRYWSAARTFDRVVAGPFLYNKAVQVAQDENHEAYCCMFK